MLKHCNETKAGHFESFFMNFSTSEMACQQLRQTDACSDGGNNA